MRTKMAVTAALAAALIVAVPVAADADNGKHKGKNKSQSKSKSQKQAGSKCVANVAFVVKGTLVSFTADNGATGQNEASVTLTLDRANRHARRSGELEDNNGATPGTQLTFAAASDDYKVQLSGFETAESPTGGEKVRVIGKVAYTKARCEPNTSVEDRYDAVNVRKLKVIDVD